MESDAQKIGNLFFTPFGRIGRRDFWLAWLVIFAVNVVLTWIPFIGVALWLVGIYCTICIYSKRLHDMGRTGWLQVIPIAASVTWWVLATYFAIGVLFTGFAVEAGLSDAGAGLGILSGVMALIMTGLVALTIEIVFLIWIGVTQSDPFDNRFGPPPVTARTEDGQYAASVG